MRQHIPSEPPQTGPAAQLPGSITPSGPRSVDATTLELLASWQEEDATADPAQLQAAEEELIAFMKTLNAARTASGEPLVYP